MAREIRISVDDDEVFERMKRRKQALDLSWEEVLKRGLRPGGDSVNIDLGGLGGISVGEGDESSGAGGPGGPTGPMDPDFGARLGEHIRRQVQRSLGESFGVEGFGEEFDDVADAEDAVLAFGFLDGDDPGTEVPLRVTLTTTADGLGVEVVAVRQGKGIGHMNSFPRDARRRIAEGLARGETATLRLDGGSEEYAVRPTLSWRTGANGRPTVTAVTVDEVVFE